MIWIQCIKCDVIFHALYFQLLSRKRCILYESNEKHLKDLNQVTLKETRCLRIHLFNFFIILYAYLYFNFSSTQTIELTEQYTMIQESHADIDLLN